MRTLLVVFLCLRTSVWSQPEPGRSAQTLVFTNVNLVDTRNGRILPGMTVVVRSGQIQGVARFGLIADLGGESRRPVRVQRRGRRAWLPACLSPSSHPDSDDGSGADRSGIG